MNLEFLDLYNTELRLLNEHARQFAEEYPGIAERLGGILEVPFPRPRTRAAVLEHPEYYVLREKLIGFLEEHAQARAA